MWLCPMYFRIWANSLEIRLMCDFVGTGWRTQTFSVCPGIFNDRLAKYFLVQRCLNRGLIKPLSFSIWINHNFIQPLQFGITFKLLSQIPLLDHMKVDNYFAVPQEKTSCGFFKQRRTDQSAYSWPEWSNIYGSSPAGTWRQNDVVLTPMRRDQNYVLLMSIWRDDVASTSVRRHFDFMCLPYHEDHDQDKFSAKIY